VAPRTYFEDCMTKESNIPQLVPPPPKSQSGSTPLLAVVD
jgi:hypothetical protein